MVNCSSMKRKRRAVNMEAFENVLINAAEFITGRLYFVSLNTNVKPKSTPSVYYYGIDAELKYDNFYLDFGPLNLAMLYHYCMHIKRRLSNPSFNNRKIVHYTGADMQKRVNAAYLMGAYTIIYLNYSPEEAYEILIHDSTKDYLEFRDASMGEPYTLSLLNCLRSVKKAVTYGFFNFDNFDFMEYEYYECVENGDFNWIVPDKFIAFCGPHSKSRLEKGYPIHSPETYFAYFRRHRVTTIVRLNKRTYDARRFTNAGFSHKDLYFVDGSTPSDRILAQFLNICETAQGAVAVHCKAGLGRTGSLIACYIMKHYKFTSDEAIAWIRICRPGSIIGHQQTWLQEKQKAMWEAGEIYRKRNGMSGPMKHTTGIYSLSGPTKNKNNDNMTGIMKKVDCMEINDPEENFDIEGNKLTQGDKLNEIKAQRNRTKSLNANLTDHKTLRQKVTTINNPTLAPTILRGGKILSGTTVRTTGTTSSRVLSKRMVDTKDTQTTRRSSQRKINAVLSTPNDKLPNNEVKRPLRKKDSSPWLAKNGSLSFENGSSLSASDDKIVVKRGKRALTLVEKEKASPRSVKVLRRSHGLLAKDCDKPDVKLRLPSVKTL